DIPVWLDNLICQLLEKKPDQRPLDAGTVAEALERIEEKVQAQQSAGADLVRSRAADRPRELAEMDDEDKAAARTLLGRKKKKRKRSGVPFYYQIWFKAAVYAGLLVGIGFVFYLVFIKRPSPEALYKAAAKMMAQDEWDEAREGPIQDFLRYYPDR